MRPVAWVGVLLIIGGLVVLAMGGFSFTRERETVDVGPLEVSAERKEFVSPMVGAIAIVAGAVLVFAGRRRQP